ncbi:MAG: hypothetical protein ACI3ZD_07680, partial [Prevotella sp.]
WTTCLNYKYAIPLGFYKKYGIIPLGFYKKSSNFAAEFTNLYTVICISNGILTSSNPITPLTHLFQGYCHDCSTAVVTLVPQPWNCCDNCLGTSVTTAVIPL